MGSRAVAAALCGVLALGLYARYVTDLNLFVIRDEDGVTVHGSYTRDRLEALQEAGIHISKYDYVSLPDGPSGRANEIQIIRANTVTITMDGETRTINTLENTVADALNTVSYAPRDRDLLSHDLDAPLEDGMEITVTRIDILIETVTQEVPFKEVRRDNSSLAKGRERVASEGESGEKVVTYRKTYRDGELISTLPESETITRPAQDRVIEVGAKTAKSAPLPNIAANAPRLEDLSYSKVLEVRSYAYTTEGKKRKRNRMGNIARRGTLAVDPRVIPLGSKVYVKCVNGSWNYGVAVAEDTGCKFIQGNAIDLFFDTRAECISFGIRRAYVYILD